jgi:hypothetical protein
MACSFVGTGEYEWQPPDLRECLLLQTALCLQLRWLMQRRLPRSPLMHLLTTLPTLLDLTRTVKLCCTIELS